MRPRLPSPLVTKLLQLKTVTCRNLKVTRSPKFLTKGSTIISAPVRAMLTAMNVIFRKLVVQYLAKSKKHLVKQHRRWAIRLAKVFKLRFRSKLID